MRRKPAAAGRRLNFSAPVRDALSWRSGAVPTLDEVRRLFAPPLTLGTPNEARIAMDAAFDAAGGYSLLQHGLAMGQFGSMASFLGYGALQNIAQNGLIRACIETVADDMTRAWIELSREGELDDGEDQQDELSPFPPGVENKAPEDTKLDEFSAEMKRLDLQRVMHDACAMTGYYGGCLLYLDTGAVGSELANPLNLDPRFSREAGRRGFLKAVRVIDPINVFPGAYNSVDPLAADYYMPRHWWVLSQQVHASRLIRVVQNEAPLIFRPAYNFLGIPQAQILWDYVMHFQDNRDAENRLLNKFSTFVFKTSMSDLFSGAAEDLAQLDARMKILAMTRSNDGVLAIDKDTEDVVKVETPLSGVADIVRQSLEILAAMNRTPAVKLLGISPSGFNATGESDIRNYYDHIRSQQEKVIRSPLKTILDVAQISLWGERDESITFDFCPLSEMDENSVAITQQTKISSLCELIDRAVISVEEARKALISDPDSGFNDLDPDTVPEPAPEDGGPTDDITPEGEAATELDEEHLAAEEGMDGRPFDSALDAPEWRTSKKGKRFQIDTETGEIIKGNVGQGGFRREARPLDSTKPDKARYEALLKENDGDHKKAAHEYFREKLQGRYVTAKTDKGEIEAHFTGGTWQEVRRGMVRDALKAELVPYMPDIIETGKYRRNELHKERTDRTVVFHEFRKTVETSNGLREVIVDVAERTGAEPKYSAYNMTHEGSTGYTKRLSYDAKGNGVISVSSGHSAEEIPPALYGSPNLIMRDNAVPYGNNIRPFFEVVNIRFA